MFVEDSQRHGSYERLNCVKSLEQDSNKADNNDVRPPPNNRVYLALLLAGSGFLLPYNSFISAVDFYLDRFPGSTIIFDITLMYICVSFVSTCFTNCLVRILSLRLRITIGYVLSSIAISIVAILDVWFRVFNSTVSYRITLLAVAVVAVGCTTQQSSYYGYTGMLPPRYTQAVMVGESAAGLLTSFNRIITKSLISNEKLNTFLFFMASVLIVLVSLVVFHVTIRSKFVEYYLDRCNEASLNEDRQHFLSNSSAEEVNLTEVNRRFSADQSAYEILINQDGTSLETKNMLKNDLVTEDVSCGFETFPSNDSLSSIPNIFKGKHNKHGCLEIKSSIKDGLWLRYEALQIIWAYMLSICMAYLVTLCLFPGIESEIISCSLGSWMPILLMAVLNLFDFTGKIIASVPYIWPRHRLVVCSLCRVLLIPLVMLCASPRANPVLKNEVWSFLLTAILGITNGYFGSVPMILAPTNVSETLKEITGNIMMLSYSVGLTVGSAMAYLLNAFIGPQLDVDICLVNSTTPITENIFNHKYSL